MRLFFTAMLLFGCLYGLGSYALLDDNEGMYASMALSMLHGGDLIIPHLNGVTYIEKPPMLFWLTAGSMGLLGANEWAARLPVVLAMAILTITMVGFLKRYANERAGLWAGSVFIGSPVVLLIGRTIYCDILLTAFISIALMAFYRWYREGGRRWLVLCYAMIALGILSKGFVALVLVGGVGFVFMLVERAGWRRMLKALDPLAIVVLLVIAAPWHIAAVMQEKDFAWFYFINEHVMRFLDKRVPHDYSRGPLWYYLIRLPMYLFPWSILAPFFCLEHKSDEEPLPEGERQLKRYLWIWFLFIFIFFSISRAKANYYVIAAMPPLAMLLGYCIRRALAYRKAANLWQWVMLALALTFVLIAAIPFVCRFQKEDTAFLCGAILPWVLLVLLCVVMLAMILNLVWRDRPWKSLRLMCVPAVVIVPLLVHAAIQGEEALSQKQPALFLNAEPAGDVAIFRDFEEISALSFYLGRPVPIVDSASSDLLFGKNQGTHPELFPTLAQWLEQERGKPFWLIVRNHYMPYFEHKLGQLHERLCVIRQFESVSIISRCQ